MTTMDMDDLLIPGACVGIGAMMLFSGGLDVGNLTGGGTGAELKAARLGMAAENIASQTKADFLGDRQLIAQERYNQKCLVPYQVAADQRPEHVARGQQTIQYVPVRDGEVLMNPVTGGPYGTGITVCDPWDTTGIIQPDGTVGDVAFAGSGVGSSYVRSYFDSFNQNLGGQ
jgi:hypothetical protein